MEPQKTSAKKTDIPPPSPLAQRLGGAAFAHRDYFTSERGELLWRNFMRTAVNVAPFVATNAALQRGFQACERALPAPLKNKVVQSVITVGASFSLFRALCKVYTKAYDRVFRAGSAGEAARAVDALPANAIRDMAAIGPAEYAATAVAAIPLVTVKHALKTPEPQGIKGNWAQTVKGFGSDWASSIPAYTIFFELTDRLFRDYTAPPEGLPPAKTGEGGAFIHTSPEKIAFRGMASVALGMLPYIALQRAVHYNIGAMNPARNSYLKDVAVGTAGFLPFAFYTSTSEAWQRKLDRANNHNDQQDSIERS